MKKWTSDILTLQKFDMRLRDLEIKYRTIPQEKARMREELEAASAVTRNAKEEQQKVERAIREMQSSIALLNDKIKKTQTQSTMVKKNTEYQAMLADIEATKEKISGLETREIELYDELESAKKAVLNAEKDYSAAERAVKAELADFDTLVSEIKEEVLKLKADKKRFTTQIDLNVLEIYRRLLESDKKGRPVVPIINGSCSNCLLKITPQTMNEAKKGAVIQCDNCSHIIYDPEAPFDYE
ncbi:MAG: zinc ribbon domain-containing protein [Victivallales bacterium]